MSSALQANGVALREASPYWLNDPDLSLGRDASGNLPTAYRALTQQEKRDLSPFDHDRMLQIAPWLYEMNPVAKRVIEFHVDYVVGEGFQLKAEHEPLQEVLTAFWTDPVNNWDAWQFAWYRQLCIFGESILPCFVRPQDGRVRLGYIDPINIKAVLSDPNNAQIQQTVQLKARLGVEPPPLPIIHLDERERSRTQGFLISGGAQGLEGPSGTFYFGINKLSNASRGRSDLLCCFDWLDLYDRTLFDQAERVSFLTDFVWHWVMKNSTEAQQQDWARRQSLPRGSAMVVTNENFELRAVSPDLRAADMAEHARLIRSQIATPFSLPEGYLFSGGETNRAVLEQQSEPTQKYLSKRQKEAKSMLLHIAEFVRDQAMLAGTLPRTLSDEEKRITVEASEVSTTDLGRVAVTLKDTAAALLVGQQNQWVAAEEAAQIFRRVASEYGVELPAEIQIETAEEMDTAELARALAPTQPSDGQDSMAQNGREPMAVGNGAR